MITRLLVRLVAALALGCCLLVAVPSTAAADADCKSSPTPEVPGTGIPGFFEKPPNKLPPGEDPFASDASSTIYQQYGYAGLRWHTYDLGCGPDAARNPAAVIGTSMSNWMMNLPILLAALTGAVTDVAFAPSFLDVFDPLIGKVSSVLYVHLFGAWAPLVLVLVGFALVLKARRANLASSTAAVGWSMLVLLIAAGLFRYPVHAGHLADDTVTASLGSVVRGLNGTSEDVSPGAAVSSSVHESILYRNWLVGELGSADSSTAREYGPELFDAQALTWREAQILENDPEAGKEIIDAKREKFGDIADEIRETDPAAYEHLTGKRSDTRIGYAMMSTLAIFLALPFLLVSSLLLLGSFLIVRLAVMLFPALAILGLFPPARGVLTGTFKVVAAALVNAIIFGVGAAVTIVGIGVILDPQSRLPGWLTVVLLPLLTFMMWFALKPFRSLTAMTHANADPFGDAAGSFGKTSRGAGNLAKRAGVAAAGSFAGNLGAIVAAGKKNKDAEDDTDQGDGDEPPDRAETKHTPTAAGTPAPPPPLPAAQPRQLDAAPVGSTSVSEATPGPGPAKDPDPRDGARSATSRVSAPVDQDAGTLTAGFVPQAPEASSAPPASEPEVLDGEEVYTIYRPDTDRNGGEDDAA